jgi:hypothetical protein
VKERGFQPEPPTPLTEKCCCLKRNASYDNGGGAGGADHPRSWRGYDKREKRGGGGILQRANGHRLNRQLYGHALAGILELFNVKDGKFSPADGFAGPLPTDVAENRVGLTLIDPGKTGFEPLKRDLY